MTFVVPHNPLYATHTNSLKARPLKPVLLPRDEKFVEQYLIDLDPNLAGVRAGLKPGQGGTQLARPVIRAAIETAMRLRNGRVGAAQDEVLLRWQQVMRADPRDLVEHWRVPCRHCWGIDHLYQYDDVELRAATAEHRAKQMKLPEDQRVEFDDEGGGGYTINKLPCRGPDYVEFMERVRADQGLAYVDAEPNAEHSCPRCHGHGINHTYYHDTRNLPPDAAALYLGVKTTGHGIEMLMRSKPEAEQLYARHMGMFPDRAAIANQKDLAELTDEQLDQELSRLGVVYEGSFTDVTPESISPVSVDGGEAAPGDVSDAEFVEG